MTAAAAFTLPPASDIPNQWWGMQDEIGLSYLAMVQRDGKLSRYEVAAWQQLREETAHHAAAVRLMFDVQITDDPEPYPTSKAMQAEMRETGIMRVSRANSEHPVWTPEQNVDFRIVHDGLGHYLSGGAFSWQGELDACSIHFRMVRSPLARRALFTECIGQVAAYYVNGREHAPQRIGFLPTDFTEGILHT